MELICTSRYLETAISTALDVTGREHLVVVAKATWQIPQPRQRPRPLPPQPLFVTDGFYGKPGESAMRHGDDFARFKPRCDLLFDACAHAPAQRPVRHLQVGVRVGDWQKHIGVIGNRRWERGLLGLTPSDPEPFTTLPLHFGRAFGGMRPYDKRGERQYEVFERNPAGIGWAGRNTAHTMVGQPVANLHAPGATVTRPDDDALIPQALGAVARHWAERLSLGGTYDEAWTREIAPFLPEDFDDAYHQCAPQDQQIPYPKGGETVQLIHLSPTHPQLGFALPKLDAMKVRILRTDYSTQTLAAPVDTLFFETEAGRFSAVWRASTPIRRHLQEFGTIAVGQVNPDWWQAKRLGLDGCAGCGA